MAVSTVSPSTVVISAVSTVPVIVAPAPTVVFRQSGFSPMVESTGDRLPTSDHLSEEHDTAMKHFAVILVAVVSIMALSVGTTFALLEWAPEKLPQGATGSRGPVGETGPAGSRGPRGPAATVEAAEDTAADTGDSDTSSNADEALATAEDAERLADEQLGRECKNLYEDAAFGHSGNRVRTLVHIRPEHDHRPGPLSLG